MKNLCIFVLGLTLACTGFGSGSIAGGKGGRIYLTVTTSEKPSVQARLKIQPIVQLDNTQVGKAVSNNIEKPSVAARLKIKPIIKLDNTQVGQTHSTVQKKLGELLMEMSKPSKAQPKQAASLDDAIEQVEDYADAPGQVTGREFVSADGEVSYEITVWGNQE